MSELSFLKSYSSVENALKECFGISKQQIKKYLSPKIRSQEIKEKMSFDIPLNLLNRNRIYPDYEGPQISIIDEDENFIVLSKPTRIHTHPLSYEEANNCLSFLREQGRGEILKINHENYDRGLVFRLDYETSGVLIYCKNEILRKVIRNNFQRSFIQKKYLAIVEGNFPTYTTINGRLSSSGLKGHKVEVTPVNEGRGFVGKIEVNRLDFKNNLSLLEITLFEGHRHQIRALLAYKNFPILGDILYGASRSDRLYLHAKEYSLSANKFQKTWICDSINEFERRMKN